MTITIKINKLFANTSVQKLCHSDIKIMMRWYHIAVKNKIKYFIITL